MSVISECAKTHCACRAGARKNVGEVLIGSSYETTVTGGRDVTCVTGRRAERSGGRERTCSCIGQFAVVPLSPRYSAQRLKSKLPLVPPKPNEFDSA
jgi:hypothetical protein